MFRKFTFKKGRHQFTLAFFVNFWESVNCLPAYSLVLHFFFLCNDVTSANLRHDGNKENLMELLILVLKKSANTSTVSLIIFVSISKIWEDFLISKLSFFFDVLCDYFCRFISAFIFSMNDENTSVVLYFTMPFNPSRPVHLTKLD